MAQSLSSANYYKAIVSLFKRMGQFSYLVEKKLFLETHLNSEMRRYSPFGGYRSPALKD